MGFLASKHFLVSGVAALLILVVGAATYSLTGFSFGHAPSEAACPAIALGGASIAATPTDVSTDGGRDRVVTFTLPPQGARDGGGDLRACVGVGDLAIAASPDDAVHVEFHVHGRAASAVRDTDVEARFALDGGRLAIAAWEARGGRASTLFGDQGVSTDLTLRVPASGPYDARAETHVGDLTMDALLVGNVTLATSVGDVAARGLDAEGNVTATSDVGKVTLAFSSVQSSNLTVRSNVGDISVKLPQRADVGYDVHARSNVGGVRVSLGETELYDSRDGHAGGDVRARSAGYAGKPTHVGVDASSDVGSVEVVAS